MLVLDRQSDLSQDLQVRRDKARKPQLVSRTDEFSILIDRGIWESSVNIQHRGYSQFPRSRNLRPRQESVRRIKAHATALVRLYHSIGIVSEKLIEVVQVPISSRAYIRGVES